MTEETFNNISVLGIQEDVISQRIIIAELEKENEQLKLGNQSLEHQIDFLTEENTELKNGTILKELTEKCKQQAEMIEKMKCCSNCKYFEDESDEVPCDDCNYTYKKWELAE